MKTSCRVYATPALLPTWSLQGIEGREALFRHHRFVRPVGIGGLAAGLAWKRIGQAGAGADIEPLSRAPAIAVIATIAKREDVPAYIQALGTVQSMDAVSVQPRVSGQIVQIDFKPGQNVTKGQSLFLIDPRPYQAALDQAQAQLAHDQAAVDEARADLTRYQRLAKTNAISEQQADDQAYVVRQAEGTVRLDGANVENAKLNLDY